MKVIIIGAGAGGIYASVYLALNGFDVSVYEKNNYLGGRCSNIKKTINKKKYRWDQGASFYLLPKTFDLLYKDVGLDVKDLKLKLCNPNYHIYWENNSKMILSTDNRIMKKELQSINKSNLMQQYLEFLKYANNKLELTESWVLRENLGIFSNIFKLHNLIKIVALDPISNLYNKVFNLFKNEKIAQSMSFQTMYMGISPFDSFGTYSLLAASELVDGIYYPKNGMFEILNLLIKRGKKLGVKYYTNTPVNNLIIKNKTTIGVNINNKNVYSDYVICNADLVWSYNNLILENDKINYGINKYCNKLDNMEYSCSTINFYWALDKINTQLPPHSIFLSDKYKESFDNIFYNGLIPDRISFYIHNPSILTNENPTITILVPCCNLKIAKDTNYKHIVKQIRKQIFARLKENNINIKPINIIYEKYNTPETWKNEFNLYNGAILGLNHKLKQMLFFRPKIKSEYINNLYFTGSSTYPGAGVQICMSSGRIAAMEIINNMSKSNYFSFFMTI